MLTEEFFKSPCDLAEHVGGEAPAVHRNYGLHRKSGFLIALYEHSSLSLLGDLGPLNNVGKITVIDATHSAGDGSVLRQGVLQHVTDHTVFAFRRRGEMLRQHPVSASSVKIISIDNGEGLVYYISCRKHCLSRSPRLDASFGHSISCRKIVHFLECVFNLYLVLKSLAYGVSEQLEIFFLDNENDFVKSAYNSIVNGKINDKFSIVGYGIKLLQAAVT